MSFGEPIHSFLLSTILEYLREKAVVYECVFHCQLIKNMGEDHVGETPFNESKES